MNAITRQELAQLDAPQVSFSLNGREVSGRATETLLQIADREGVAIPRLCYTEGMEAVGNCRSCMVEINGERVLAPSCCRFPTAGMKVVTDSDRAIAEALGPILAARGLLLVGLDVIGDKLTEINVTSPTCFQEITDQMGFDVAAMFVDALEAALER